MGQLCCTYTETLINCQNLLKLQVMEPSVEKTIEDIIVISVCTDYAQSHYLCSLHSSWLFTALMHPQKQAWDKHSFLLNSSNSFHYNVEICLICTGHVCFLLPLKPLIAEIKYQNIYLFPSSQPQTLQKRPFIFRFVPISLAKK